MAPSTGFSVHMSNVPLHLTDDSLTRELAPYLKTLSIQDWDCNKPRNKPFAILTFLRRREGQTFLKRHGQQPTQGVSHNGMPRMKAQLHLLRKPVFCKENEKGVDSTMLKVLERNAEERNRPIEPDEKTQSHNRVVFEAWSLACGHYDYPDGKLTYTADMQWNTDRTHRGIAKFARNALVINFPRGSAQIRLEIPYRTIHEVVVSDSPPSLFLTLWEPPRIFSQQRPGIDSAIANMLGQMRLNNPTNQSRAKERERLCEFPHNGASHSTIVGQSLIYTITISPEDFASKIERLRANEYLNLTTQNIPISSFGNGYMTERLATFNHTLASCSGIIPFDTLYQFEGLVKNGYMLPRTAEYLLFKLLNSKARGAPRSLETNVNPMTGDSRSYYPFSALAVKKLFLQIEFPGPYAEPSHFDPEEIWSLLVANEKEIQQGLTRVLFSERARQNLTMVYKVQVTPTRILLSGPEPEAKNRILRKFPDHTEYFARIQFCDEDGQDIHFNPKASLDEIFSRFNQILLSGLRIAGRLYKFLGAARIGQAFSETPTAVDLVELRTEIQVMEDVTSADGTRVFSDGVGTMSRDLLDAVLDNMPHSKGTATCLQIRWAGAKGMLSLDETLKGSVMRVRNSMTKFNSNDVKNLEICDTANKPIPLVLNRQMIKILEDMKVPESWFFKLQTRELDRLRKITADTNNTIVFLKRQKIGEQMVFHRFIRRLLEIGFDYKKDPFLCSVIEAVVLREVRLLKHKSRIPVQQGVTLFGVMDEFGYLGDDEVYVTFDKEGVSFPNLNDRLVIITRSPALHPGDIQIRRAIVPPRGHPLRSLSNCIVFSQKGSRDLPSQLSGGDLDGDIYNIIWDPIAVEGCKLEFPPADYPRVPPLDIGRNVESADMTRFFVTFMATDQLGVIATRHIILADYHEAGTVNSECQLLAEMHSTAVDYSKTGVPVDMNKMSAVKRLLYRPDFLAPAPPTNIVNKTEIQFEASIAPSPDEDEDDDNGPRHKFYKSFKILGKLYRAIDEKKIWRDDIHVAVNRLGPYLWDELFDHITRRCEKDLGHVDWMKALDEARSIRQAYDDTIWTATIDYSDHSTKGITEVEVFTGMIFNKSGVQTRRQRDRSTHLKDEFDRITKWIESLIRKHDPAISGDLPDDVSHYTHDEHIIDSAMEPTALELSIACLHAGIVQPVHNNPKGRTTSPFQSFKVIAAHCALRELEIALKQREIAAGAISMGGGYPGVRGRNA